VSDLYYPFSVAKLVHFATQNIIEIVFSFVYWNSPPGKSLIFC